MDENNILDSEQLNETSDDVSVIAETDIENDIEIVEEVPGEENVEPYALTSVVPGTISDSYLDYFEGIVQKLSFEEHYVVWKSGDYVYTMAYGEDIEENNGRFIGDCNLVQIMRQGDNYNSQWIVDRSEDTLSLSPGSAFVYSDLGMYPTLERGLGSLEADVLLFGLAVAFVFSIVTGILSHVGFRHRR